MSSGEADAYKGDLAGEEVPHKFETKNYWMEKYFEVLEKLDILFEHTKEAHWDGIDCTFGAKCEICPKIEEFLSQNGTNFGS